MSVAQDAENLALPRHAKAVIAGDAFPQPVLLYVGGDGDVEIKTSYNEQVTFKNLQGGSFLTVRIVEIVSATATDLVVVW